ncbi:MAG: hypothetical protein OEU92_35565 [Alphaproteobacteria bacterium]|nr:hypothetical protein [Alphaproteobacteria bacterium]
MTKRKLLEDVLDSEFRWPIKGDKPFVVADDPLDNANLADDGFTRLRLMKDGYKNAADLMVVAADNDAARNMLVFPIVFNYRHFLELSLKFQLATYGPTAGIEPNWKTHCLAALWNEFLEMLDRYGTEDPDEADPVVGDIIREFAKIDPGSYSHRYPVDRRGTPIPLAQTDLHLPTLAGVMDAAATYFRGCDVYLSSLVRAA